MIWNTRTNWFIQPAQVLSLDMNLCHRWLRKKIGMIVILLIINYLCARVLIISGFVQLYTQLHVTMSFPTTEKHNQSMLDFCTTKNRIQMCYPNHIQQDKSRNIETIILNYVYTPNHWETFLQFTHFFGQFQRIINDSTCTNGEQ